MTVSRSPQFISCTQHPNHQEVYGAGGALRDAPLPLPPRLARLELRRCAFERLDYYHMTSLGDAAAALRELHVIHCEGEPHGLLKRLTGLRELTFDAGALDGEDAQVRVLCVSCVYALLCIAGCNYQPSVAISRCVLGI